MYALLTLPRGVPIDPEAPFAAERGERDAPVGIVIRPGPAASFRRMHANEAERRAGR